jgi:hypothetical protein
MATKLAKNGTYMEYIIIRPTFGFTKEMIANALLLYNDNIPEFKSKFKTWNKIMDRAKYIILEEGLSKLDYTFEMVDNYDVKKAEMINYLTLINPQLGKKNNV